MGRDYSVMVVPAAMVTFVTAVIIFSQVITKNNEFCRLWSWLGCFSSLRLLFNLLAFKSFTLIGICLRLI